MPNVHTIKSQKMYNSYKTIIYIQPLGASGCRPFKRFYVLGGRVGLKVMRLGVFQQVPVTVSGARSRHNAVCTNACKCSAAR